MAKRPAEVFGFPITNASKEAKDARKRHWCPFVNRGCSKQSRLIDYPMGVCSVEYRNAIVSICPVRFMDSKRIFENIADMYFKTRNDLVVIPEVKLKPVGTFDYIMAKHKSISYEIEDFVAVEIQTGQTTGTGSLVQGLIEFVGGEDISNRNYGFGLNLYDVWKRSFTQILNKGLVLEKWKQKIFWVVQQQVFDNLVDRYRCCSNKL